MGVDHLTKDIRVKIQQEDFDKVNELLLQRSSVDINEIDKEYHLFSFADEELVEIVSKPDEWSHYDYSLALKILKERGKEVSPELAAILRKNRVAELARPEPATGIWIAAGYAFALIGGLVGIIMGIHIYSHKKLLPNGDKVYGFKEEDRKHGFAIATIGIGVIVGVVIFEIWMFRT